MYLHSDFSLSLPFQMPTNNDPAPANTSTPDKQICSIVSLYWAQDVSMTKAWDVILKLCRLGRQLIICSDVNAHAEAWGSVVPPKKRSTSQWLRGLELTEFLTARQLLTLNITPHPPSFTSDKRKSHIDATFATQLISEYISNWEILHVSEYASDHCAIRFHLQSSLSKELTNPRKRKLTTGQIHEVVIRMKKSKSKIDPNHTIDSFIASHTRCIQTTSANLLRQSLSNRNNKLSQTVRWWTDELTHLFELHRLAGQRLDADSTEENRRLFAESRKTLTDSIYVAKIHCWKDFVSNIKDPWALFFKIIRRQKIGLAPDVTLCNKAGIYAVDIPQTLEIMCRQFYPFPLPFLSIHTAVSNVVSTALAMVSPTEADFTMEELRLALSMMNRDAAPGEDNLSGHVIVELAIEGGYEEHYLALFNSCLRTGYFPQSWKSATVIVIPKGDNVLQGSSASLRPISLTSNLAKLFERLILQRVMSHLERNSLLADNQHAYRKGKSTQTALYGLISFLQRAKQAQKKTGVIFLDISGAFDRTWHDGILFRLLQYQVPLPLVQLIRSFLSDRTISLSLVGETRQETLDQGCPQGGVLSPILWNILINDLLLRHQNNTNSSVIGYADDTTLAAKANSWEALQELMKTTLDSIQGWATENRVMLNPTKLKLMLIGKTSPEESVFSLSFGTSAIARTTQHKHLGIIIDASLSWLPHLHIAHDKAKRVVHTLQGSVRQGWGLRMNIMRLLFHSVIKPILLYGALIWARAAATQVHSRKFDRLITLYARMSFRLPRDSELLMPLFMHFLDPLPFLLWLNTKSGK